jgi:flagellin-like protein
MGNMKANKKFKEADDNAVSAVIGVILMVAITVAIAATVYVYVSGMIGGSEESGPALSWQRDAADNQITITKGTTGYAYAATATDANLIIKNATGDVYYVLDDMSITTTQTGLEITDMSAGDTITGFFDGEWTLIWEPTNTVIGKFTV